MFSKLSVVISTSNQHVLSNFSKIHGRIASERRYYSILMREKCEYLTIIGKRFPQNFIQSNIFFLRNYHKRNVSDIAQALVWFIRDGDVSVDVLTPTNCFLLYKYVSMLAKHLDCSRIWNQPSKWPTLLV